MWQVINNRKISKEICSGGFYPYGRCTVVLVKIIPSEIFKFDWCAVDYCKDLVIPEDIKKEFEEYISDPLFEIELEQYLSTNGITRYDR